MFPLCLLGKRYERLFVHDSYQDFLIPELSECVERRTAWSVRKVSPQSCRSLSSLFWEVHVLPQQTAMRSEEEEESRWHSSELNKRKFMAIKASFTRHKQAGERINILMGSQAQVYARFLLLCHGPQINRLWDFFSIAQQRFRVRTNSCRFFLSHTAIRDECYCCWVCFYCRLLEFDTNRRSVEIESLRNDFHG